jgi:hypothetical protein|tara:strand:+ start:230 stop:409 length:180 start_codon:yes stop_codon:yes gene_type:complete
MAQFRYKDKITDDIEDAKNIIQSTGRMLMEGKIDKKSAIDNLARAFRKLESSRYYIDRT